MVCARHEEHQGTLHNINNSKEFWVLFEKMCLFKAAPLQRFLPVAFFFLIFSSNSLRRPYSGISLALNDLLMSWDSALGHAPCSTLLLLCNHSTGCAHRVHPPHLHLANQPYCKLPSHWQNITDVCPTHWFLHYKLDKTQMKWWTVFYLDGFRVRWKQVPHRDCCTINKNWCSKANRFQVEVTSTRILP